MGIICQITSLFAKHKINATGYYLIYLGIKCVLFIYLEISEYVYKYTYMYVNTTSELEREQGKVLFQGERLYRGETLWEKLPSCITI